MPIKIKGKTAHLSDAVTVEEAQALHEFLLNKKDPRVDLKDASHLHTAVLQVLMAARPRIARTFDDEYLQKTIAPTFS